MGGHGSNLHQPRRAGSDAGTRAGPTAGPAQRSSAERYIDPPDAHCPPQTDAVVSWWVIDAKLGSELKQALEDFVPRWLADTWGFAHIQCFP